MIAGEKKMGAIIRQNAWKQNVHFFAQLFDAACPVQAATKCSGGLLFLVALCILSFDTTHALPGILIAQNAWKEEENREDEAEEGEDEKEHDEEEDVEESRLEKKES